ncbi:MAG TPA: hypothetical protein VNE82_09905 [Candidatus Binataceae bacterium]|nr:hypothetical protein [Candidatus Binataceae bacterium]
MNRAIITPTLVRRWAMLALAMASLSSGCFYPPTQKPPAPSKDEITLGEPYDLVWDAVHNVIRKNKLSINADDPNEGIVETETNRFTLADADCGRLKGIGGKYAATPDRAATAVYYFKVKPKGHEASVVSVQATFSAPLYVPLRPTRDEQCVSRGKAEARLLKQIAQEAATIHRPAFVKPAS